MPIIKINGVILRHANYKDNDRMLTILTHEHGLISARARGCRKIKGKLRPLAEDFVFSAMEIYFGKGRYSINSGYIHDSFYDLREDLDKLSCAYYIRDLCIATMEEQAPHIDIFTLVIKCLSLMAHEDVSPLLIKRTFEVKLMSAVGFKPELMAGVECGVKPQKDQWFSKSSGGIVCRKCLSNHEDTVKVLAGMTATLRLMEKTDIDSIHILKIGKTIEQELARVWDPFVVWHVDKRFSTSDFANKVNSFYGAVSQSLKKHEKS